MIVSAQRRLNASLELSERRDKRVVRDTANLAIKKAS
jgi:hypothetical protein